MRNALLSLVTCTLLCGCASFMEKVIPPGTPKYTDVLNAADKIPRGTPKWVVKMKLGMPQVSGPRQWHYVCYGPKIAEAKIFFDEKDRVTDVQTNAKKEFYGRTIIRRGGRR